ncbi:hypothetical protein PG993_008464 [Apiospora rasikravindrae]|uniref:Uncharacterized protein n=1 Tax=Apiospora rasikravindrae TaxID=990691 RepID=A0ABR1T2R9_9PEZI
MTSTRQDQLVGWQSEDDGRGTWAIVINCLTTIFACTWSIQHLNVPGPLSSDGKWSRLGRSAKWMALTILFPEFMVLHALFELMMAVEALQSMKRDKNRSVELPWWLLLRRAPSKLSRLFTGKKSPRPVEKDEEAQTGNDKIEEAPSWTLTHCFLANMGGFRYHQGRERFPLTALQIAENKNRLFNHPEMTENDIHDRSKQDWFVKVVASLQFLQLALSLIVRTSQGLAFSQLETITVGFAVCGAIVYLLYFYKPQGVQACFVSNLPRVSPGLNTTGAPHVHYQKTYDSFWDVLRNKRRPDKDDSSNTVTMTVDRIPNDNIPISQNQWAHPGIFLLALTSALFGAMHAIAWNFEFPSALEKILWHVATIISAASPVAGLLLIPVAQLTVCSGDPHVFLGNCLRLVREASWHVYDKAPWHVYDEISWRLHDKEAVQAVYKRLENIYLKQDPDREDAQVPYKEIFSGSPAASQLPRQMAIRKRGGGDLGKEVLATFPKEFASDFCMLVRLMEEMESKKLNDTAKTNVFPRKIWLPEWLNHFVLYSTSALYVVARLCILAVGLSSLRQMPASVYLNTPWTAYIPSVGSG